MQHVEFFHKDHFEFRYFRKKAKPALSRFIDFFWETDFDTLFHQYPQGFSDALFPNIGYTYLVNLGTPFIMQLGDHAMEVRTDGFLPRHKHMVCHHFKGNRIFGIKFKVSPVLFEKKIDFSEYREYVFPLSYLIDRDITDQLKCAPDFEKRIAILSAYYEEMILKHSGAFKPVEVVTQILKNCNEKNQFNVSIEALSSQYRISSRTLQRYFEATTSLSSKQALQIMRIRKAVEELTTSPQSFHFSTYGYYDYSHFYKNLRSFVAHDTIEVVQPHLKLLKGK